MIQDTADNTFTAEIVVQDRHGLHLRCASELARLACGYGAELSLSNGKRTADMKSMLGLITLAAVKGTHLMLRAQGEDAKEAVSAVCEYFTRLGMGS
ncbi:MAG: HPr family phosphocarrier protein [Lentisphaeria bacterium]|nr:HPr family phosphocarrier protein [Victivallales bacterium]MBR6060261.1 HPr family phosphocarrier protein [Victivallales bacterium]MCR4573756.1 HPr family phosphocarrier protein [Lentisphaeria bacterium]